MPSLAASLLAASALIIIVLGSLHVLFTFSGTRLHPRDAALLSAMKGVSLRLTRETSMWKAWVGFNASHGLGAILFGLVYGYLALANPAVLFRSGFLLTVGLVLLLAYCVLGWKYWFSVPFRGIACSTALYVASLVANWA